MLTSNFVAFVLFVVKEKFMQWCFTTKDTKNTKRLGYVPFKLRALCVLCG
jgi:hypothetical protein